MDPALILGKRRAERLEAAGALKLLIHQRSWAADVLRTCEGSTANDGRSPDHRPSSSALGTRAPTEGTKPKKIGNQ